jgi:hypothetical protein
MAKEIGGYTAAEWSILCLSSLGILQIVFALTEWNNCPAIPGLNLMTLLAGAFAVPIAFAVHFTRGNSPEYMEKQDMRIVRACVTSTHTPRPLTSASHPYVLPGHAGQSQVPRHALQGHFRHLGCDHHLPKL